MIVLGSGPAGYTAAIYAARAMRKPVMINGPQTGGQLTITTDVENYPGFADPVQGPWLMEQMRLQAQALGVTMIADSITTAHLDRRPFLLIGESGAQYSCQCLIIATGAQAKWLGLPSEAAYRGHGVSACATCDGFFFKGKEVILVGGGNTAAEEALFLTNFATRVHIVHRRNALRADRILQERVLSHPKISVIWDSVIDEVLGGGDPPGVTGARVHHLPSGDMSEIAVHGVFIAIGHLPATGIFAGQMRMKDGGYIATEPGTTRTSIHGVYVAGDAGDDVYRQAVTAAGMGCMAALDAEGYLSRLEASTLNSNG